MTPFPLAYWMEHDELELFLDDISSFALGIGEELSAIMFAE